MGRAVVAALAALLICALGCGKPVINGSDLEASIARVRKSVDSGRQSDFDTAVTTVVAASRGEVEGTPPFALDGMTADAIFGAAEKIALRRDLVWAERAVARERQVIDTGSYLARLRVRAFSAMADPDGQVQAIFEVDNGLDSAIDTAWIRIDAPRYGGGTLGGEDIVVFSPSLKPGEKRNVRITVASEAGRVLAEDRNAPVTSRFTLVELGGNMIAQEPTPEALDKAQRRLAEEERRRDELRAKLGSS